MRAGSAVRTQLPSAGAVNAGKMTRAALMGRVVSLFILALLAAVSPAAAKGLRGTAAQPTTTAAVPFDARIVQCTSSPRSDARMTEVAAAMQPVPGASRLALRIDIHQRKRGTKRWVPRTDVPGLGTWTSPSDPTIGARANDVYKYRQAVRQLVGGYAYRFRVAFRWLDPAGRVVREEAVVTSSCRQPELRPDLVLVRATVRPARSPELVAYDVVVRNVGRTAARGVQVAAALPGAPTGATTTRWRRVLGARQSATFTFFGRPCSAAGPFGSPPPAFVVDPRNTVDEAVETNNQLTLPCQPAP